MSFVKSYDPGKIYMDLPASNYIYELPLLSFADIHGTLNLSLVFNYRMKDESSNPFHIMDGYKLNLQKRLIMENSIPTMLQEENGKCTDFISTGDVYVLDNADQRILRRTGTNYTLENMDFSREIYDQTGKILSAYDKYDTLVLTYGYDSSGRLTSITYRSTKTVLFTYASNQLAAISYAGCTTNLTYASNKITVSHYSGMKYTLLSSATSSTVSPDFPWLDFSAVATDSDNANEPSRTAALTKSDFNTLVISYKIGGDVVDAVTYDFANPVEPNCNHSQIEVTNKTGVKTRFQYQDDILRCSYEVTGNDVTFENDQYKGSVQLYKTMDETDNSQASGAVAVQDGAPMLYNSHWDHWEYDVATNFKPNANGYYLLTGWIRDALDASGYDDGRLCISNHTSGSVMEFIPDLMPGKKWTFFAYKFYLSANSIYVYLANRGMAELKDVRLAFYSPEIEDGRYAYHVDVSEDILISYTDAVDVIVPVAGCTFTRGSLNISDYGTVSFSDLLKYKLNQRKGLNTTEFYCDRGKKVLTANSASQVTVTDPNGNTYNLNECYLGSRQYTRNGTIFTQIVDNNSDAFLIYKTAIEDGALISSQSVNNYLDVISATADGVTTAYTRNKDQVTAESVANLYTRTTAYSTDSSNNPLITVTNEFSEVTKYTLDPIWGCVKQVVLPDGTTITDTYDDDMCAMTKRTFGNTSGRSASFEYTSGNLSGLQSGGLTYGFSYTKGKLASVSKNNTQVESHTHTDTTTQSYYPSQSGALHSSAFEFDTYGRLTSIAGVLTNTYDVAPSFHSSTGALVAVADTGNALLAMSVDEVRGEAARFTYNENGMLTKKEVTAAANYATKVSQETFQYDALNRLTADSCTYNAASNKRVSSQIVYQMAEDNPAADNRVKTYTYAVGGSGTAVTQTTYDTYKRRKRKSCQIGGKTFTKSAVYKQTRLDYETDSAGGTTDVSFDNRGRTRLVKAEGKTTKYTYDQYGQLSREDNQALAKTYVYAYNDIGNVASVKAYSYTTGTVSGTPVTTSFGYTGDKLTSFNGTAIAYNTIGCPTTYEGKSCTWTKGRLTRMLQGTLSNGSSSYNFSYNAFGQRVSKTYSYMEGTSGMNPVATGTVTAYTKQYAYDHAGRLIAETITKTLKGQGTVNESIVFLYDQDSIIGMEHTTGGVTSAYYFHRNPLGDVVGIYNTSGTLVAKYLYDAWGNCTIASETTNTTLAKTNPIRYRGYYYDLDTDLYYCNARYYSPKWRRFISPDDTAYLAPDSVNGLNLYCYCNNDPVNLVDPSGHWIETVFDLFSLGASVVEVVINPADPWAWA